MLSALNRLLDQNRAAELIDFILIFALLLALAMLILFLLVLFRSRRLQREIRESSSELYYFLLPTLALDGKDHQLIKHLAEFLPFPQQKHRIMVNPRIFDFCARRLLAVRPEKQGAVTDLRSKLGFPQMAEDLLPGSTRDLPLDMPVILVRKGSPPLRGSLIAKDESSLSAEIQGKAGEGPAAGPAPSTAPDVPFDPLAGQAAIPVSVYFQNRAGFFGFPTRITVREERVYRLEHSDKIKRYQRRRYTRRQLRLPVFIQPYGGTSTPLKTVLIELSGGGASLQNPDRAFTIDQQVELSFAPQGEKFHVLGRIVRLSKRGRVVHVEFQALDEAERERIGRLAAKR
jgi:hypothetical protein